MADKGGKSVKINTTESYNFGQTPGLNSTIAGMEQFDMNVLNDPSGEHTDLNGPSTLGGKK